MLEVKHLEKKSDIDKFFIVTDDYKYSKILFPNFEILKGSMEDDYFSILNGITFTKGVPFSISHSPSPPVKINGKFEIISAVKQNSL